MYHRLVLSLVLMLAAVLPAQAQLFRAYVSISGNDSNPCTLPAPCRLLPAALNAVASGGEIWMLDSANYNMGPVAITKSVTLLAVPGAVGSVVAAGGNALDISGDVKVTLRNLVVVNLNGTGTNGIAHSGSGELNLIDCDISGLTSASALSLTPVHVLKVTVRGSLLRGNNNGILALGLAEVSVDRSQISGHSARGILLGSRGRATVSNSVVTGNAPGSMRRPSATAATSPRYWRWSARWFPTTGRGWKSSLFPRETRSTSWCAGARCRATAWRRCGWTSARGRPSPPSSTRT